MYDKKANTFTGKMNPVSYKDKNQTKEGKVIINLRSTETKRRYLKRSTETKSRKNLDYGVGKLQKKKNKTKKNDYK